MPWSFPWLVEELAAILRARDEALALEQAVRGLDHCDERAIQALLAEGLSGRYEVAREAHYPSSQPGSRRSHRLRSDLLLTHKGEPLWLEVKVAHQRKEGGAHNGRYGQQWRRAIVGDLRKLKADPQIARAGLAFVAFTDDEQVFERDVATFEQLLVDEELLCGFRSVAAFPITDRLGHRRCSVALWPLV